MNTAAQVRDLVLGGASDAEIARVITARQVTAIIDVLAANASWCERERRTFTADMFVLQATQIRKVIDHA